MSAASIADDITANREQAQRFLARVQELDELLAGNTDARARATVAEREQEAAELRAVARGLEQERDDLTTALAHLDREHDALSAEHTAARATEAQQTFTAAQGKADAAMRALRARVQAFAVDEALPKADELAQLLDQMKQAGVHTANADSAHVTMAGSALWTQHAPLFDVLNALRALADGKTLVRTQAPTPNANPALR